MAGLWKKGISNLEEQYSFFNTVVLTSVVFAACVTSVFNMAISIMNNHRLKKIEKQRSMREIDKYRYCKLYELILNWNKYDAPQKGKTAEEIAFYRMVNLFIDDSYRYEIAKPLLDKYYVKELEIMKLEGNKSLNSFIETEAPDGTHSEDYFDIKQKYFDISINFSEKLKASINRQLEELIRCQ